MPDLLPLPGVGDVDTSVVCLDDGGVGELLAGLVFECEHRLPGSAIGRNGDTQQPAPGTPVALDESGAQVAPSSFDSEVKIRSNHALTRPPGVSTIVEAWHCGVGEGSAMNSVTRTERCPGSAGAAATFKARATRSTEAGRIQCA